MNQIDFTQIPANAVLHFVEPDSNLWKDYADGLQKMLPGTPVIFTSSPIQFLCPPEPKSPSTAASHPCPSASIRGSSSSPTPDEATQPPLKFPDPEEEAKRIAKAITGKCDEAINKSFASLKATAIPTAAASHPCPSASIRGSSPSPTPQDPLPPIHHGLTYPADSEMLTFLGRNLQDAIRALGPNDETLATKEQRFEKLRHLAQKYQRTDLELIDSILTFSRLPKLPKDQLVQAVHDSLRAAWLAEAIAANQQEIIAATAAVEALKANTNKRYTQSRGLTAIWKLTRSPSAKAHITPELQSQIIDIIARSTLPESERKFSQ